MVLPTLKEVLTAAPTTSTLTGDIIVTLDQAWGDRPVTDFTAMTPFNLAVELTSVMADPGYDNRSRLEVSKELLRLLQDMGLVQTTPAATAGPTEVTVRFPQTLDQMTLRDLLELLKAEPGRRDEILPYVTGKPQVQTASTKVKGAWVIPDATGGIDIAATLAYVSHLAQQYSVEQHDVNGRRPTTLGQALGINTRPYIHPFTGRPIQGADETGFDPGKLEGDLHLALLWAAMTKHRFWPLQIDPFVHPREVTTTPLNGRWQTILDDFRYSRGADEDSARIVMALGHFWPESLALNEVLDLGVRQNVSVQQGPLAERTEDYYRRLVEERAAIKGTLRIGRDWEMYNGGPYSWVEVRGTGIQCDHIVALGGAIYGPFHGGVLLVPHGVQIRDSEDSRDRVEKRQMTWKELAEHLKLV